MKKVKISVKVPEKIILNNLLIVDMVESKASFMYDQKIEIDIDDIKVRNINDMDFFIFEKYLEIEEVDEVVLKIREYLWEYSKPHQDMKRYDFMYKGRNKVSTDPDYRDMYKIMLDDYRARTEYTFKEKIVFFMDAFKFLFFKQTKKFK